MKQKYKKNIVMAAISQELIKQFKALSDEERQLVVKQVEEEKRAEQISAATPHFENLTSIYKNLGFSEPVTKTENNIIVEWSVSGISKKRKSSGKNLSSRDARQGIIDCFSKSGEKELSKQMIVEKTGFKMSTINLNVKSMLNSKKLNESKKTDGRIKFYELAK